MPRTRAGGGDRFSSERQKIRASNILDALIEFAEGRRDMSSSQVSAALGLLKKALPDFSTESAPDAEDRDADGRLRLENDLIEYRIVDPHS